MSGGGGGGGVGWIGGHALAESFSKMKVLTHVYIGNLPIYILKSCGKTKIVEKVGLGGRGKGEKPTAFSLV